MAKAQAAVMGTGIPWEKVSWEDLRDAALRAFQRSGMAYHHTHNTWLTLEVILRLCWTHGQRAHSRALYAVPSEAWLGEWLHLARETVSDHIRRLEAHGLLLVTRRRPIGKAFQTNLYRISGRIAAHLLRLVARAGLRRRAPNPVPQQAAALVTPLSHARVRAQLGELGVRWLNRGSPPQRGNDA